MKLAEKNLEFSGEEKPNVIKNKKATIVVSIERENEFKQHARTSRAGTRERT